MNINRYRKNISTCNKNCVKDNSCFSPLFEVENFLCNLKKVFKCINLYKFFK